MPLARSNRLQSTGFRWCSCTDLQLLKGAWECHKCCPNIITFLQKMREKRGTVRWRDFRGQKLSRVRIPSSGCLTGYSKKGSFIL